MVKADDLFNEQKDREKKRNKIYKKIYKMVEKKIVDSSRVNNYQCMFEVPYFMINLPLYSQPECINYICNKLNENGFKYRLYDTNKIIVSWKK
jgi:hypothetical protein